MEQTITSMMDEKRVFNPNPNITRNAEFKSLDEYRKIHKKSIEDPESFWANVAKELVWYKKWDRVLEENFKEAEHKWFIGGKLNVTENCLDRHAKGPRKNKAAIIWEGDIGDSRSITYQELYYQVNKFANVLDKFGIKKGDCVCIYLPMIPELVVAMLACARIGAVHSIVFGGFAAEALRDRIQDSGAKMLICADGYYRGGKVVRSKDNADGAVK
jgi:acetyl-CoA synthetase